MTLESLLLSEDPDLVRVLRPTLEKMSIDVEICHEARVGSDILISDKFDAVIVDCDDLKGGLALLQGLRSTPSNRNSVAFAVLNGKRTTTQEAFGMGANFVLQKPISTLNASRCFHAALNFMLKERRRYFRQPIKMQVKVVLEGKTFAATSTNISEGGIALMLRDALPKGAAPHLQFALPDSNIRMEVEAEVAWSDMKGSPVFASIMSPRAPRRNSKSGSTTAWSRNFPARKNAWQASPKPSTDSRRLRLHPRPPGTFL
jgi:CheY-like chemotaxis protein